MDTPTLTVFVGGLRYEQTYIPRGEVDEKNGYRFRLTDNVLEEEFTYIELFSDNHDPKISCRELNDALALQKLSNVKRRKGIVSFTSNNITLIDIATFLNIRSTTSKHYKLVIYKTIPHRYNDSYTLITGIFILFFIIFISYISLFILNVVYK